MRSELSAHDEEGRRTAERYEQLLRRIEELDSVLVAFSGGVDSTLLAVAAHAVLGERCIAVLAVSDTYPASEVEDARRTAHDLRLRLMEVETHELTDARFRENGPDRCYHCKRELFGLLRTVADVRGLEHVADGSNVDDDDDHRPGDRAGAEYGVVSPLREAGLTKADVRAVARMLGLPNSDKPSMACLASRIPYGCEITESELARVAAAEDALRQFGLGQFRVRSHGDVARVEVAPEMLDAAWDQRERMADALRSAGFTYAALDLDGYESGRMNDTLSAEELQSSGRESSVRKS